MKKLLIVVGLFLSLQSFGQFGFKGGVLVSKFKDQNSFVGYTGGIFYSVKICEHFYLQPEINYSKRGFKSKYQFIDANGNILSNKFTNNYLDVPILAKLQLLNNKLFVMAGPSLYYVMDKWKINSITPVYADNKFYSSGYSIDGQTGVAGILSASVNIPVKNNFIVLEGRIYKSANFTNAALQIGFQF